MNSFSPRTPRPSLLSSLFLLTSILGLGTTLQDLQAYSDSYGSINSVASVGSSTLTLGLGGVTVATVTPTTPTVLQQLPNALMSLKNKAYAVSVPQYVFSPSTSTNVVLVNSSLGNFYIQLFPTNAPLTVANFLKYVNDGGYANTIFNLALTNTGSAAIIQSGGYSNSGSLSAVPSYGAIPSEFAVANLSNIQGSVAMALATNTNLNSATSQWFVNLADNSSYLDATNTYGNAPTTVFGQVLSTGMSVVQMISALPTDDFETAYGFASDLSSVPLQDGWTSGGTVYLSDLVTITNVMTIPYFVTSSEPSVYSAHLQGSNLVINYTPPNSAQATPAATITAYALDTNGNEVTNSFQVSDHKLVQTINFPPNYVTYNATNASNYLLTNLPTASSGLPVTVKVSSGPAKEFLITNQVVTSTTNSVVNLGVTNIVTNNVTSSVTNTAFILTGPGNVTLTATQPGDALYDPAPPSTGYLTVYTTNHSSAAPQMINQSKGNLPDAIIPANSAGLTINLSKYIPFPLVSTNTTSSNNVLVSSSEGSFVIQLFPTNAPATVANFLNYVTNGLYNDMIIDRLATNFFQTGGYLDANNLASITNFAPITNEAGLSNVRGTLAMLLDNTNADSATSQWFINTTNNSSLYDTNNTNGNLPFTVFGQVLGTNGMNFVNTISKITTYNLASLIGLGAQFQQVPLVGWDGNTSQLYYSDFVTIYQMQQVSLPVATATSSDTNSFAVSIQSNTLIVTPLAPNTIPVTITVIAADTNGDAKSLSFQVSQQKLTQNINFQTSYTTYSTNSFGIPNFPTSSSGLGVNVGFKSGPLFPSGGHYYLSGPGTITLIATQPGNPFYDPAPTAIGYVIVDKGSQTINFPAISNQSNVATPSTINISAPTSSVGLPVKLTLVSGPATLVGRKLTLTGTGTVTLIATQPGTANYYPATPITNSFTVTQLPLLQ